MEKYKHTPGKWEAVYDDDGFYFVNAKEGPSPYIVATGGETETDEANAEVIAAIPDMIATLRMAREELEFGGDHKTARKKIDDLLSKFQIGNTNI